MVNYSRVSVRWPSDARNGVPNRIHVTQFTPNLQCRLATTRRLSSRAGGTTRPSICEQTGVGDTAC